MQWLKRLLIGKPLESEALHHEKYSVFWGLPVLASDSISSVAYATEEILMVLVPAPGPGTSGCRSPPRPRPR